ncbi:alpha-hydroxy acid oxidase [Tunturiibacter lichenicola]|uniref:alpha-hydroxy acid oxidase n=1 Tax=Tunturiibacter lichenicola TaxID=2051959 RepID=UPI003D9BD4F2
MPNRKLNSSAIVNIEDLRRLAERRVPRSVFDYLDGGADAEITLAENCRAFRDATFRPRSGVAVYDCKTTVSVLGHEIAFPAILAPVSYIRLMHSDGEAGVARAAGHAGTIYTVPTISGHKLEDVKTASTGPLWYQLYLLGGRQAAEGAIDRARRAGYSALVLTVDTPMAGKRERDPRNGMKELLAPALLPKTRFLPNILAHPRWLASFLLDGGVPKLGNVVIPGKGPMDLVDVGAALSHAGASWEDLRWIREMWPGPIVAKGVLTGDDARRAVDEGAAAVVVSNHGGRQLDTVSPSLHALPEIVEAVGGQVEVLMDGGVRRGSDIVKAICLGARAVLIGRAYAYGLAAAGEAGVARAIKILKDDLDLTLTLLGCPSIDQLDGTYLGAANRR